MKHFGIELEFFVVHPDKGLVPAYKVTSNVDGNPVIGELRTKPSTNIVDVIFELKKLLYIESGKLVTGGNQLVLSPSDIKANDEFLVSLRKDPSYINRKTIEVLDELSVYGKKTGKILPRGLYKSSLQINISDNEKVSTSVTTISKKKKQKTKTVDKWVSNTWDFYPMIKKLDSAFAEEIKQANRVPGVVALKQGDMGTRIEYRSLPSFVDLYKVIDVIKSL